MGLVNCVTLMKKAAAHGFAVPAFNIDNLESAIAVVEGMNETGYPVIIQTIPRTLKYGGIKTYPAMVRALNEDSHVDYCLHLDHGNGLDLALQCVKAGFSSVMYDGSALPYPENVQKTAEIRQALPGAISLEAELGAVGGREETECLGDIALTDPDEALDFMLLTGADTLAVGVGNAHGVYKGKPNIRVDRIAEIRDKTNALLVLHGASGLSDKLIGDCIKAGIAKINFATELRIAYTEGIKEGFAIHVDCFDPKVYMRTAIDRIKRTVVDKIKLCYGEK